MNKHIARVNEIHRQYNNILAGMASHKLSQIEANVKPQFKQGKGINGQGNDPYQQVEFTWKEDGWNYSARWHNERQGAPEGSGSPWIISRKNPGTPGVYDRTVRPKKTIVEETKSVREVYLQPDPTRSGSSSEWGSLDSYKNAKNTPKVRRSDEQNNLLDRAHWESNPNTQ